MILILEQVIKMAQVIEAGIQGDIHNRDITVNQLVGAVIQPQIINIISRGGL